MCRLTARALSGRRAGCSSPIAANPASTSWSRTAAAGWKQFGRPSGVALRDGLIYVADSESNGVAPNPGWKRGIRVGELKSGRVLYRIPDPLELKGTSAAEGIAVDAMGDVYGGEVGPRQLSKHVRQ